MALVDDEVVVSLSASVVEWTEDEVVITLPTCGDVGMWCSVEVSNFKADVGSTRFGVTVGTIK